MIMLADLLKLRVKLGWSDPRYSAGQKQKLLQESATTKYKHKAISLTSAKRNEILQGTFASNALHWVLCLHKKRAVEHCFAGWMQAFTALLAGIPIIEDIGWMPSQNLWGLQALAYLCGRPWIQGGAPCFSRSPSQPQGRPSLGSKEILKGSAMISSIS